eukprot:GHVQ01026125.1.p1 GENE.GHVQ01026125.1~~GHVQ01026125.1.p1  ORF type:complete len:435 (+),score=24.31 GHVQ01026125.1:245-1549(+)
MQRYSILPTGTFGRSQVGSVVSNRTVNRVTGIKWQTVRSLLISSAGAFDIGSLGAQKNVIVPHRCDITCTSGDRRYIHVCYPRRCDDAAVGEIPKFSHTGKYFDLKRFRNYLKKHKQHEEREEARQLALAYAQPAPEGWDVNRFLKACGVKENLEEASAEFKSWEDLVSTNREKLSTMESLTGKQRRLIKRRIMLFKHGLWPTSVHRNLMREFQAAPLGNEGKVWTAEDDQKLLHLAEYYDISFGDPWIYISWEMQREFIDVYNRYVDIALKPEYRASQCDLVITKASRPLLMNRSFKLLPSFLYIVPSETNYPLKPIPPPVTRNAATIPSWIPSKFHRFRQPSLFRQYLDYSVDPPQPTIPHPSAASVSSCFTSSEDLICTEAIGNNQNSAAGISFLTHHEDKADVAEHIREQTRSNGFNKKLGKNERTLERV